MDLKKTFMDLLKEGSASDSKRAEIIEQASELISILNQSSNRKLTKEDLNKIQGGSDESCFRGSWR